MKTTIQSDLRRQLKDVRSNSPCEWEASRHMVGPGELPGTLDRLRDAIVRQFPVGEFQDDLLRAVTETQTHAGKDRSADRLKAITGLPTTKSLRALCVYFGLAELTNDPAARLVVDDSLLERVTPQTNPFDVLLECARPSLLDLGAGDLSFVESLAAQYVPKLRERGCTLTAHAVDRAQPGSGLAPAYQAPPDRLGRLRAMTGLSFHYWHGADMFALAESSRPRVFLPRYDVVTCWAPANPTFAYEPTRLAPSLIQSDLERTRGRFRNVRADGEPALEVTHQGRSLLFPPWKFDVHGPVALLDLMSRCGSIAMLGAVDDAVFWECLSQLVADPLARPRDRILTAEVRHTAFGELYEALMALPVGGHLAVGERTPLRNNLPRVLPLSRGMTRTVGLRYVGVRRGAVFPGMPVSLTATRYQDMSAEAPPWFILLVPDDHLST
ncbi:hypothetical protein YTPLAS18_02300 [Nitrospira sp.]|nr:hypothetical protein YTPLAS18_02300 [Nitrospira sp.]